MLLTGTLMAMKVHQAGNPKLILGFNWLRLETQAKKQESISMVERNFLQVQSLEVRARIKSLVLKQQNVLEHSAWGSAMT